MLYPDNPPIIVNFNFIPIKNRILNRRYYFTFSATFPAMKKRSGLNILSFYA